MTIEILEHVYPRTGSHLLHAVLQILDTDLGPSSGLSSSRCLELLKVLC